MPTHTVEYSRSEAWAEDLIVGDFICWWCPQSPNGLPWPHWRTVTAVTRVPDGIDVELDKPVVAFDSPAKWWKKHTRRAVTTLYLKPRERVEVRVIKREPVP